MSPSSELEVVLPAALHARPAGEVVRAAARFPAAVEIRHGARSASARSALKLMSLGVTAGATVTVHAEGEDAAAAAAAVAEALRLAT
ncbi:phosphatidylglycerol phosphate synthetase [Actinoplanes sp. SE50]|uniref:HPr family phosphocarrier protein n=1 Tax=unclassified Actinoplanes TaxID=2626549 RepID=UPI00023EC321|nr:MULTISPECIES: HPr family phosphocarrier protein [unclassified Actinoplanes]AEV86379.1 Phosphocarrier protein HPr [Actinoplanes sp. SE50/110]ATO84776.1 phosphatidylglycerol phosphate synthetase [Actinoplanes sp. SE50]SLM02186.1 Phosphocarrier protein HPr [Actinoplanes sp. SE50/110]